MEQILLVRDGVEVDVAELYRLASGGAQPEAHVALQELDSALDRLASLSPAELAPALGLEVAAALLTAQDRVQALALRHVADVHTRDLHLLDAAPSTGTWVEEQHTSMPRSHVALAGKLERIPQVAARIAAGGISVDGGMLIGRALERLRPHVDRPDGSIDGQPAGQALPGVIVGGVCQLAGEAYGGLAEADPRVITLHTQLTQIATAPLTELARLESAFLLLARHVPARLLRRALAVLVDALLPNQLAERSHDAHARRSLELIRDPETSGWLLRGVLDDECGERLQTALTAAMSTDPENLADTADRQIGDQTTPRRRSRTQRRHDALNLLLGKILDSRVLGSRGKVPVQIAVTTSLAALHNQPGALPARTGSGATVPAALVRRWLCDSAVTRFVLSLGNKVIESSHTERTATPHERRIKHLETGGICQGAGCSRGSPTGDSLVPHHATPYAICKQTSLEDTVLLCPMSHDDVHVGGKTIRLKDGRYLNATGWVDGPS